MFKRRQDQYPTIPSGNSNLEYASTNSTPAPTHSHVKPNEKPKRKKLWGFIYILAIIGLIGSLAGLGVIGFSYWQGQQEYKKMAEQVFEAPSDSAEVKLADLKVNWHDLQLVNPDVVAWIYVPGTPVNYPVVQTHDNEKYITHDFKGNPGIVTHFGAIFVDANNTPGFKDFNTVLFGHHMNDGSMFAFISGLFNNKDFNEHRTIYLLTPSANYRLETFSLIKCRDDDPLAQGKFPSRDAEISYIDNKYQRSEVKADPTLPAQDINQMFTLVTCDNVTPEGREALFAAVVDKVDLTQGNTPRTGVVNDRGVKKNNPAVNPNDVGSVGKASKEYE